MNDPFPKPGSQLDHGMLGKIMVARILELPLDRFAQLIHNLDQRQLPDGIVAKQLPATIARLEPCPSPDTLGRISFVSGIPQFQYFKRAFTRDYQFDKKFSTKWPNNDPKEQARLVGQLRLINTRNRLTHALVTELLHLQDPYLTSEDPLLLRPLSQANVESPRVWWRLQSLREWSHEQIQPFFP